MKTNTDDWWEEWSSSWRYSVVRFIFVWTISASHFVLFFFFSFISFMPSTLQKQSNPPVSCCCVKLDVNSKCLRFLSVCAVLPRRSYSFASCCLVKTLAWPLRWVEECNSSSMGLPETQSPAWVTEKAKIPEQWNWWAFYCEDVRLRLHCFVTFVPRMKERKFSQALTHWIVYSSFKHLKKLPLVWSFTHQFIHLNLCFPGLKH